MIEVLAPGLFTTVQDRGRVGHYASGFPPAGALDRYAHDAANAVVGNASGAATLELTVRGPVLRFTTDALIAVTGAAIDADLDGVPVGGWMSWFVRRGQILALGSVRSGVRAYLSVRGGIDVPPVMGSRSTFVTSRLGGHEGRPLVAGDVLAIGEQVVPGSRSRPAVAVPGRLVPEYPAAREIRVVAGLCDYRLTPASLARLHCATYRVSVESNRTGCRLDGEALEFVDRVAPFGAGADPSNVVNLGYPVGSIQAPSGSELICLLRDAVTGGGYATVATVISADLDLLAQAGHPDEITFSPVSIDVALAERARVRRRIGHIADVYAGLA